MTAGPEEDWFTDSVWENPWSNGRKVLVFVAPIRRQGRVAGVCYLEYDFEGQTDLILRSSGQVTGEAIISVLDRDNGVVASTGGYRFGEKLAVRDNIAAPVVDASDHAIVAQAPPAPYHGFDGLGLRCVIEQRIPDEAAIAAALNAAVARRRSAGPAGRNLSA